MAQPRPPIGQYRPAEPPRRTLRSTQTSDDRRSSEDELDDEIEGNSPVIDHQVQDYLRLRQNVAKLQYEENLTVNPILRPKTIPTAPKPTLESSSLTWVLMIVGVIVIGFACFYCLSSDAEKNPANKQQWLRDNWAKSIRFVRDKFPSQKKNIWSDFYSGIQKVLLEEPTEPSIFLLVHRGTEATSSCLARKVGEVAHNYLNASRPHPLLVDGGALREDAAMMEDRGLLIETYRPLVEEHRIMILDNLQLVPATIAQALHIFCDTVTPLVRKAVYIFTLNVDSGGNVEGNPTKVAETELNLAWKQMDRDTRSALVTRITSGSVFRIEPEEGMRNVC